MIKPIQGPIHAVRGIAGATELGDQDPVLVLDVSALVEDAVAAGRPHERAPERAGGAAPRWEDRARRAAERRDADERERAVRQLLIFELDGSPYALPVECVREIVRLRPITPVPRVPADVRGVISLRGEIVQVIDLRRRLGCAPDRPGAPSRIVVVHGDDGRVAGLLVDARARGAARSPRMRCDPPPGETGNVEALVRRAAIASSR